MPTNVSQRANHPNGLKFRFYFGLGNVWRLHAQ